MPISTMSNIHFSPGQAAPAVPYVLPGTVGYRGTEGALTPYAPAGSGLPGAGNAPPGWSWQGDGTGLRNDSSPLTLDHVHIYGGLYTTGSVITVTNSVIEAGPAGAEIACIMFYGAGGPAGGVITVHDSTLTWHSSTPDSAVAQGYDVSPVFDGAGNGPKFDIQRCDLSRVPQGLNPAGSNRGTGDRSLVINNYIHNIVQNNIPGDNHLDGLYHQGAPDLMIQGNYIDTITGPYPTACVFFHNITAPPGDADVILDGNYLSGGGYTYYNETAVGMVVTNNTFSGLSDFGDTSLVSPGTIAVWTGNKRADGTVVPQPS